MSYPTAPTWITLESLRAAWTTFDKSRREIQKHIETERIVRRVA